MFSVSIPSASPQEGLRSTHSIAAQIVFAEMLIPVPRAMDVTRNVKSASASLSQAHGRPSQSSQGMEENRSACRDSRQLAAGAGQTLCSYLRTAQAYMLISMPTGTSTIFGVFQVIWFSHVMVQHLHRRERKTAACLAQGFVHLASQTGLPQQTQQRSPCRCSQLPGIECSVGVLVGCIETLFDDGQIFIQRQGTVVVGIGGGQLARAPSSRQ